MYFDTIIKGSKPHHVANFTLNHHYYNLLDALAILYAEKVVTNYSEFFNFVNICSKISI